MGMDSIHNNGKKRAVVRPQQPKQTGVTVVEWRLHVLRREYSMLAHVVCTLLRTMALNRCVIKLAPASRPACACLRFAMECPMEGTTPRFANSRTAFTAPGSSGASVTTFTPFQEGYLQRHPATWVTTKPHLGG